MADAKMFEKTSEMSELSKKTSELQSVRYWLLCKIADGNRMDGECGEKLLHLVDYELRGCGSAMAEILVKLI